MAGRRRQGDGSAGRQTPSRQQALARFEVEAKRPHIAVFGGGDLETNAFADRATIVGRNIFLDDDRIGVGRQRRARKDPCAFSGRNRRARRVAGRDPPHDGQHAIGVCKVGRSDCVPIHRRNSLRRVGTARMNLFGQGAAGRVVDRHPFRRGRGKGGADSRLRLGHRNHPAASSNTPDLPPDLWASRRSVMRMPRSIALHIS